VIPKTIGFNRNSNGFVVIYRITTVSISNNPEQDQAGNQRNRGPERTRGDSQASRPGAVQHRAQDASSSREDDKRHMHRRKDEYDEWPDAGRQQDAWARRGDESSRGSARDDGQKLATWPCLKRVCVF
jgi:hypothetical protein